MNQLLSSFEERRYFPSEKVLNLFETLNHNFIKEKLCKFHTVAFYSILEGKEAMKLV